ncbi:MAG: hypothetical protein V4730_11680 [Pseudomonadota bacterium]
MPTPNQDPNLPVQPLEMPTLAPAPVATPATASTYTGAQGTAAKWDVDSDQTVQGQVKRIIDENGPLSQQATTAAAQDANRRGLINSSMAVQAGQEALYKSALPIAAQDAATYARRGEFNAGTEQQTGLANQQSSNQANAQSSQLQTNVNLTNAGEENKVKQITQQQQGDLTRVAAAGQVQKDLAVFSAEAAKTLAGIEATYKNLTQASSSAASIMNNTIQAISRIMEDTGLDAAGKQKAIDIYNTNAQISLSIIGSLAGDVELGQFMDAVLP